MSDLIRSVSNTPITSTPIASEAPAATPAAVPFQNARAVGADGPTSIPQAATPGAPQIKAAVGIDGKIDARVVDAVNTFAFKLQALVAAEGKNTVVSGASVASFLALMTSGATPDKAAALLGQLGLDSVGVKTATASFKALATQLNKSSSGVEFAMANSVWADKSFSMDGDFVARVKDDFGATAVTTDLPKAADEMNGWVETATKGVIKDFVSSDELSSAYFAAMNAIYFKGTWTTQFDPQQTNTWTGFAKADGQHVEIPIMNGDIDCEIARGEGYHAAKLPYGADKDASMLVIVPDAEGEKATNVAAVLAKLASPGGVAQFSTGFAERKGALVNLPKFEVETETDLLPLFAKLGVEGAGPYDAIGARSVSFDIVKQKAKITVDEAGTVAAAVTGGIALESMKWPDLDATRPFVYAIVDNKSGLVAFTGTFTGE